MGAREPSWSSPRVGVVLILAGCQIEVAASAVTEVNPIDEASSTSGGVGPSSTTGTVTTEATSGDGSGGGSEASGSSGASASVSGGEELPDDPPPTIASIAASPAKMSIAGPITIEVEHSEDVVAVEIWRGDAIAFEVEPTWETMTLATLPIVHAPGDEGAVSLHAVVRDAGGQTATSVVTSVVVELPPSGALAWEKVLPDGQESQALAVAALDQGTVLGGYWADANLNASATLGGLDAGGSLSWSAAEDLPAGAVTTAIARRSGDGRLIVAGYTWDGEWLGSRPWARIFDADGQPVSALWQGEPTSVVRAAAALPDGRVALAGAVLTGTQPTRWDARVWILGAGLDGVPVVVSWENDLDNVPKGLLSDEAHAVTVSESGEILIAGVTETIVFNDMNEVVAVPRAFLVRYGSGGAVLDSWLATDELGEQSAALGVSVDPQGGILLAGWSKSWLGVASRPFVARVGDDLALLDAWIDASGPVGPSEARRIVRAPSGQLVVGLSRFGVGFGTDVVVLGIDELASFGAPLWSHTFADPSYTDQRLLDLDVGTFGFIHFAGWTFDDGAKHRRRIVGVLHP